MPPTIPTELRQHSPLAGPSTTKLQLTYPTPTNPHPSTNPPLLTDALRVRHAVFVTEQGCDPANEIDADDARSWHWVLYASGDDREPHRTTPIGVIRLVPPPHAPHEVHDAQPAASSASPAYDLAHEPYIRLTRVAVLPEYRGRGFARRLVDAALEWAAQHPDEIDAAYARVVREQTPDATPEGPRRWTGLALVHAQVPVEDMYRKLGFVRDDALGRWYEEGIEHVGMWRRVPVRS
ncbi:hypothetical protein VTN02DRAFT_6878 [Thermoascus thermophilus]